MFSKLIVIFLITFTATYVQCETGQCSWYGPEAQGQYTACGEKFDWHQMTAAHKTLPCNTMVKATNQRNGQSVTVRINDRGPYITGRILDLSLGAARKVNMVDDGVVPCYIQTVGGANQHTFEVLSGNFI